jgi:hypothetical protein
MNQAVRYRINGSKVIFEIFDDEIVLINQDNGNYYSLVNVGAHIWGLIQKERSMNEIVHDVAQNYATDQGDIEAAVVQFLTDLQQEDLIESVCVSMAENGQRSGASFQTGQGTGKRAFEAPSVLRYTDMQDLLLLDPIHEIDESGWPASKQGPAVKKNG